MKIDREEIKELSQKKLLFWLIDTDKKINHENLKIVQDEKGDNYFYTMFYDTDIKKEPNVVELNYDNYIRLIMFSDKISGIAIDIKEEVLYINRRDFRWFMIMKEEEKYLKIESDIEKMYNRHLENIRMLWLYEKYKDIEDYLTLIDRKYEIHSSELNYYYGKLYETMGYIVKAEQFYRNAVKQEGNNFWLFYQLALYYNRNGVHDKEWTTCRAAYKQFHNLCYGNNVYDKSMTEMLHMMLNNPKCKVLSKKMYMRFIKKMQFANQKFEYQEYSILN